MTDPIQIKHYKEDITSFNQLYKEFQRRFVRASPILMSEI